MGKYEILDRLIEDGNGYLQTTEVLENKVSKRTLARYVEELGLSRVAHGVYSSEDAWADDYYLLFLRNGKIVFSYESVLSLHGLMDREPSKTTVTVTKLFIRNIVMERFLVIIGFGLGYSIESTASIHEKSNTL